MIWKLGLLFCVAWGVLGAGPLDDKSPAYFVDRYGPAQSSETVNKVSGVHYRSGAVIAKGQFSVREYRNDKLRVQAVFFLPSLKLAAVTFRMGQAWTDEQIKAALKAYGDDWRPVKRGAAVVKEWVAPDGSNAIHLISSLHIQSKPVVDAMAKELSEQEAKRKAVPEF